MTEEVIHLSLSDHWNKKSIDFISYLQDRYSHYEDWIVEVSYFGDNKEAFTFFFPIFAGISAELGARVLWAAVFVEWSNLILKWLLKGDRPYWWIQETSVYEGLARPHLHQFPNTCESGPGSPSGHLMMNAALSFVVCQGLLQMLPWNRLKLPKFVKCLLTLIVILTYVLWISVIALSRLYIQAHFIHQCILGVFFGIGIGLLVSKSRWLMRSTRLKTAAIGFSLMASTIGIFAFLRSQGFDPLWSVPLAMRHCAVVKYVSIDRQPLYIVMRFTGAALGLGLGLAHMQECRVLANTPIFIQMLLAVKGGLLLGRVASILQSVLPTEDMMLYLTLSLGINIVLPYLIIAYLQQFLFGIFVRR